jgi:hypothetical protein
MGDVEQQRQSLLYDIEHSNAELTKINDQLRERVELWNREFDRSKAAESADGCLMVVVSPLRMIFPRQSNYTEDKRVEFIKQWMDKDTNVTILKMRTKTHQSMIEMAQKRLRDLDS